MKLHYSFLAAVLCCTMTVFANGVKIGDLYYLLDDGSLTAKVTYETYADKSNYASLPSSITIPATVQNGGKTYKVTAIGTNAFYKNTTVSYVQLGTNITDIEASAFQNCTKFATIYAPNSKLARIGEYAFQGCKQIVSHTLPASLRKIEQYAYAETGVSFIKFPENLETIGARAFDKCTNLKHLYFPASLTEIGDGAFNGCSSLLEITNMGTKPLTLKTSAYIFTEMDMASVNLRVPFDNLQAYKQADVWNKFHVVGLILDNQIRYMIDVEANTACVTYLKYRETEFKLKNISIPESVEAGGKKYPVTKIGDFAFYYHENLTEVTLPEGIIELGISAFVSTEISAIKLPSTLVAIGKDCFYKCLKLAQAVIPENVKTIGDYAFNSCEGLISVSLPEGLQELGYSAFGYDNALQQITNYSPAPLYIGNANVFVGIEDLSAIVLRVPYGSQDAYNEAEVWKDFTIVEMKQENGVEEVQGDKQHAQKVMRDGRIVIMRDGKEYDVLGTML